MSYQLSCRNYVGERPRYFSVRQELLQLVLDEVEDHGERGNWASILGDMLADHEMYGGPSHHLEAESDRASAVLRRWRRMYKTARTKKVQRAVQ
jgi:hypothetical protein